MKKISFDADVDFNGQYSIGDCIVKVSNERGVVTLEFDETKTPQECTTSGFLRTEYDEIPCFDDLENGSYSATTATLNDDEEEFWVDLNDDMNIEDEEVENYDEEENDEFLKIAEKITEYDKDGLLTELILTLIETGGEKKAVTVCKMLENLTETLQKLEKKFYKIET